MLLRSGHYLPERCETNAQLAYRLAKNGIETSDDWIVERTGIRQRYLAAPHEKTSDLATAAAKQAIAAACIAADSIDLIIVATSTPDVIFPSTACFIQQKLGISGGAAFDVQAVCSGFVYALATADAMIRAGTANRALVIGAEIFSNILNWQDRTTCVLFGDGAGAVVLDANENIATSGILASRLHANGSLNHILNTPGQIAQGVVAGSPFLYMDGQAVFKQAVTVLDSVAREVCAAANLRLDAVDWLIPHQANVRILAAVGKKLGIPADKTISVVDQHANTSAASVPLALDVAVKDGRVQPGQLLLLLGVGGGFTWGANLLVF